MMDLAPHPGATRRFAPPPDWDEAKHGPCGTLEVADLMTPSGPFMESLWRPSADDLALLNAGGCLKLGIRGSVHPVGYLGVTAPPKHDVPIPARIGVPFQERVRPWMLTCFGPEIAADTEERNHRFLEEALELVQACGCTESEAHQLVDYVFGRPAGEKGQEVGGVMVTLAALCLAQQLNLDECGETELARIWTKVEQIRAKQAAKPKHSPLPIAAPAPEHG